MQFLHRTIPQNSSCLSFRVGPTDFNSNWHTQADFEIMHMPSSPGQVQYQDVRKEYEAGSILILGPGIPHVYRPARLDVIQHAAIVFDRNFLAPDFFHLEPARELGEFVTMASYGLLLKQPEEQTVSLVNNVLESTGIAKAAHFLLLLENLSRQRDLISFNVKQDAAAMRSDRLRAVLVLIRQHADEDLRLDDAARAACMSSAHFSRFFSRSMGVSFKEYLLRARIDHACALLRDTDLPVTDIAYRVGFASLSAFNRMFAKLRNQSPREYRKAAVV